MPTRQLLSSLIFCLLQQQQQQSCEIPRFSSRYSSSPLSARSMSAELLGGKRKKEKGRFRIFDICAVAFLEMGFRGKGGVEFSAFAQGRMRCRAQPIHSFVPSNLCPSSILPIHRLSSPPTNPPNRLPARTPLTSFLTPERSNQATYIHQGKPPNTFCTWEPDNLI